MTGLEILSSCVKKCILKIRDGVVVPSVLYVCKAQASDRNLKNLVNVLYMKCSITVCCVRRVDKIRNDRVKEWYVVGRRVCMKELEE